MCIYNWEAIALVHPFKGVIMHKERETTVASTQYSPMEAIRLREIGGLVGRIQKDKKGWVYLVEY